MLLRQPLRYREVKTLVPKLLGPQFSSQPPLDL